MSMSVKRILVADDDPVIRKVIQRAIEIGGWAVQSVVDGDEAWAVLGAPDPPRIAVLDWQMPRLDGLEVCRRVRARASSRDVYLLILTARTSTEDVVSALDAGADDYIMKPFHAEELRSRLRVAERILTLESALAQSAQELEHERRHSARLEGLLPICVRCKRIRDDQQRWSPLEEYIGQRSEATLTHGLCDECSARLLAEEAARGSRPREG